MKNITNFNNKAKILILIGWTLILVLVTVLVVSLINLDSNGNRYKNFKSSAPDKYVSLSVTMNENRKSSFYSANKSNNLESSTYDFVVFLSKNKQTGYTNKFTYLNCKLVVITKNGEYVYKESSNGNLDTNSVQWSTNTKYYSFTNALSKKLTNKSASTVEKDETPEEILVLLDYKVEITNDTTKEKEYKSNTYRYRTSVKNIEKFAYNEVSERTGTKVTGTDKTVLIEQKQGEFVDLKLKYDKNLNSTTKNEYFEDKFSMEIKYSDDASKKVVDSNFYIIGKTKNEKADEDDRFSNYVYLGTFFGSIPQNGTIKKIENSLDTKYELEEVYVFATLKYEDGTTNTIKYLVKVANIEQ